MRRLRSNPLGPQQPAMTKTPTPQRFSHTATISPAQRADGDGGEGSNADRHKIPSAVADTSNSGRAGRDVFRARSGHSKSRSSHQGAHIAPRPRSCSEWATHPVPGALGANLGSIVPPGSCGATEPLKAEPANLEPGCPLSSRAFCVNNRIRTTRDLRQTNADLVARSGVRVAAHGGLCRPQRFYAALTYCGGGCEGLTAMPTHGREAYVRS